MYVRRCFLLLFQPRQGVRFICQANLGRQVHKWLEEKYTKLHPPLEKKIIRTWDPDSSFLVLGK